MNKWTFANVCDLIINICSPIKGLSRAPYSHSVTAMTSTAASGKKVHLYLNTLTGFVLDEWYDPDHVVVSSHLAKDAFMKKAVIPLGTLYDMATIRAFAPGAQAGELHTDELHGSMAFAEALNRAIMLAVRHCPPRAPHSLVFVGTSAPHTCQSITRSWRACFNDKYIPVPDSQPTPAPTETPLMRWYNARKELLAVVADFKAAETDLIDKLNTTLKEKADDPTVNSETKLLLCDVGTWYLEQLAELKTNPVVDGHPARFAAYEEAGFVFGPVQPAATHDLHDLGKVKSTHRVRVMMLPWCTDK